MKQHLQAGDTAPAFSVKDVRGRLVRSSDYSSGYILLAFMRYSGCPYCNLAIHRLAMEYPLLQKHGCEVIAFVQSDKQHITENIIERHAKTPQFPIIADPAMHIYEQYGVTPSIATTIKANFKSITKLPYWVEAISKHGFQQKSFDGQYFLVPGYFLVNAATGRIVRAHYGTSFYEHETFTKIYQPLVFKED